MTINVWWREFDFISYLFKFLSVRPQYIRSIFAIFFREIFSLFFFDFLRNFRLIFSLTFALVFLRNFRFFCETDWSEILWKNRKFSHFLRANEMRKYIFFLGKMRNFRETINLFFLSGNLILGTLWQIFTGNKPYNNILQVVIKYLLLYTFA